MSKQLIVTLEDGRVVICAIVEHSYRHDADARAAWCSHDGREFVAYGAAACGVSGPRPVAWVNPIPR